MSGVCSNGTCQDPSCTDGVGNGNETDIDCGGVCPACPDGQGCEVNEDCASLMCVDALCAEATCTDTVRNGDETAIDCGGSCPGCSSGSGCVLGTDCLSGVCTNAVCQDPTCTDTVRNGDETGTDCGGSCDGCDVGGGCNAGTDCLSGVCLNGACQAPTCTDTVRNGDETDVDCGGSCDGCADGLVCNANTDCASGRCLNQLCTSEPDYSSFGTWTTVAAGNLGGANVPMDWPDNRLRQASISSDSDITIQCARPPSYWTRDHATILTQPMHGRVYYRRGGGSWGLRYDGACTQEPPRRLIQNLAVTCPGIRPTLYLRVRHTAAYPLPNWSRFVHNGACYQIIGFSIMSRASHWPLAVIEDPNRFTPGQPN